jgi:hypothetical protein
MIDVGPVIGWIFVFFEGFRTNHPAESVDLGGYGRFSVVPQSLKPRISSIEDF